MPLEFSEVGARDLAKKNGILDGGEIFLPGIEDGCPRHTPCYTLHRILGNRILVNRILAQFLIHRVM
jgi:hypothetical protein